MTFVIDWGVEQIEMSLTCVIDGFFLISKVQLESEVQTLIIILFIALMTQKQLISLCKQSSSASVEETK